MKKQKILLFANLAEIAKAAEIEMEVSSQDTGEDIIKKLINQFPAIKEYEQQLLIAVDETMIELNSPIGEVKKEIAILPPVSGG